MRSAEELAPDSWREEFALSRRARSKALQQRAERFFPGGVNSPVRAFRAVGGSPPFIERAEGAYLYDADGNRYHRLLRLLGPDDSGPRVSAGRRGHRARGAQLGQLRRVHGRRGRSGRAHRGLLSGDRKMRFVSSGTEATMSAIRVARAATGRKIIIKFEGCYHGHADGLLVKAGSGVATFGIPGSAGVPEEIAQLTLALPLQRS